VLRRNEYGDASGGVHISGVLLYRNEYSFIQMSLEVCICLETIVSEMCSGGMNTIL
jgi:hypothetical protein